MEVDLVLASLSTLSRFENKANREWAWGVHEASRTGVGGQGRAFGNWPASAALCRLYVDDAQKLVGSAAGGRQGGTSEGGANPRFVVTTLSSNEFDARVLYEYLYCACGEMENRIKEYQLDLFADRTSTRSMAANQLLL